MALKFFGRGSVFADDHTSAYFSTPNKEMVIIDCPVSTFNKLKRLDLTDYESFYILITHTHSDHIGGIGLFIQYAFFILKKPVFVAGVCTAVIGNVTAILRMERVNDSWFTALSTKSLQNKPWFISHILTEHCPELDRVCFGYQFNVDNKNVVYTGDTSTLEPFLPYLTEGSILYVDVSVNHDISHLNLQNTLDELIALTHNGVIVHLMHLDDIDAAEKLIADYENIEIVDVI